MRSIQRQRTANGDPAGWGLPTDGTWRRGGFTLIEIMLAVAILAIISLTVYQFTDIAMRATGNAMQASTQDMACAGLRRLVATQLDALPSSQNGTLIGVNTKGKDGARHDAMQLICPAGNAVLTPDAKGYYQLTLDLRETPRGSGRWALGMERAPWSDDDDDDDDDAVKPNTPELQNGRQKLPSDWLKLIDNATGLEIAYFDGRLNGWVDKWTDATKLPNLVRLRVLLADNTQPYEIVERVPGGGVSRLKFQPLPPTGQPAGTGGLPGGNNGANGANGTYNGTVTQPGTTTVSPRVPTR